MDLRGRSVVVTGASSGIGAAIAAAAATRGARLMLAARSVERLEQIAEELGTTEVVVQPTDVGEEDDVRAMVAMARERFGGIDLLVNNAGFGIFKQIVDMTTEEFDAVIRVNLRGVFLCIKHALPLMEEQGGGTIVTISSLAGKHGFAGGAAYCASKFGVMGLTESIFHEARSHGVRMVTICPGSVDTPFFDEAGTPAPNRDRILRPEDVADAVMLAATLPERALLREIDIRPANPR